MRNPTAYLLLLVAVIDGNRRRIGAVSSARFDLSGTTLPFGVDAFF
jgi:hypothetical protein